MSSQEPRGKALPFDDGIGGEMTRFSAADPKQALACPCTQASRSSGGLDNPCLHQARPGRL